MILVGEVKDKVCVIIDDMADTCGTWRGTNGISTNGVTAFCLFFDRGTFWVLPLTYFYLPQSARACLFPQSVKFHYFCSGPISVDPICPQPRHPRPGRERAEAGRREGGHRGHHARHLLLGRPGQDQQVGAGDGGLQRATLRYVSCLRSPWGDFIFKWNYLKNTECLKTTQTSLFKGFHWKRRSPQRHLKQKAYRKRPVLGLGKTEKRKIT